MIVAERFRPLTLSGLSYMTHSFFRPGSSMLVNIMLTCLLSISCAIPSHTIVAVKHHGMPLDIRKVPIMMTQALGTRRRLSLEDLGCEECLSREGMVEDLSAIGIQIVDSSCGITTAQMLSYLRKVEGVLNVTVKCDSDMKVLLQPPPVESSVRRLQGQCRGGNPRLGTNDPMSSCQGYLEMIRIAPAWDRLKEYNGTTEDVVLAIADTGVYWEHPDLANRFWKNPKDGSIGYNFIDNNTNVYAHNSHGTQCAGVAAAQTNNSVGIAGVAGTSNVKLMILKFLDSSGDGLLSNAMRSLNFAVEHGAAVSSHSYGYDKGSATFKEAIENAAAKGHVFVTVAGNYGVNLTQRAMYPCVYASTIPSMLCVTASTSNKGAPIGMPKYASFGPMVHVAAPGDRILSTYPPKSYIYASGTSYSGPQVAAVASLLASIGLRGQQIADVIIQTAKNFSDPRATNLGELDALDAISEGLALVEKLSARK